VFINQNPIKLFKNLFAVMMGHKTMVGFDNQSVRHVNLPLFKNSLIHVEQALDYAKNYSIEKDLLLVFKGLKKLGQ
jgi:lipopolysaccharide/colanic/teichoic acid biosynthesis glycosyltransferase